MTDFLTIATRPYPVQTSGGASENEPDFTGSRERAFDNTYRSTRANGKRNFTFIVGPISPASYDQLIADTRPDKVVAVAGGFLNGAAAFNAFVDVIGDFVADGTSVLRVAHVTIAET